MSSEQLTPLHRQRFIDRLMRSPEAPKFLDAADLKDQAERKELRAAFDALLIRPTKAQIAAAKRVADAIANIEAIRAALSRAYDEHAAAQGAVISADPVHRAGLIERQLRASADPRIVDALWQIERIWSRLPEVLSFGVSPKLWGRGGTYHSNVKEMGLARRALGVAKDKLTDLQLAPISRPAVTAELKSVAEDLRSPLGEVGLTTFGVDVMGEVVDAPLHDVRAA
jgi:hypothetical protein